MSEIFTIYEIYKKFLSMLKNHGVTLRKQFVQVVVRGDF